MAIKTRQDRPRLLGVPLPLGWMALAGVVLNVGSYLIAVAVYNAPALKLTREIPEGEFCTKQLDIRKTRVADIKAKITASHDRSRGLESALVRSDHPAFSSARTELAREAQIRRDLEDERDGLAGKSPKQSYWEPILILLTAVVP